MTNGNDLAFGSVTYMTAGAGGRESGTLTKREYFAAMAMQAIIGCGNGWNVHEYKYAADYAVSAADALIKALNKEQ